MFPACPQGPQAGIAHHALPSGADVVRTQLDRFLSRQLFNFITRLDDEGTYRVLNSPNLHALLSNKDNVCNNVCRIFHVDKTTIVNSTLAPCLNVTYMPNTIQIDNLYDQKIVTIPLCAQPKRPHIVPESTAEFVINRYYTQSTISTSFDIEGDVVKTVNKFRRKYLDLHSGKLPGVNSTGNQQLIEEHKKFISEVLTWLETPFLISAALSHYSLEAGLKYYFSLNLRATSIPFSLATCIHTHAKLLAGNGKTPGDLQKDAKALSLLADAYVKNTLKTTFAFAKEPVSSLNDFIGICEKVCDVPTHTEPMQVLGGNGTRYDVKGVLLITKDLEDILTRPELTRQYPQIAQVQSGHLVGKKTLYLKPITENDITKSADGHFIMSYEKAAKEDHTKLRKLSEKSNVLTSIIDRENDRVHDKGFQILNVTDVGSDILKGNGDITVYSQRKEYEIETVGIHTNCLYVLYKGNAYVFHVITEEPSDPDSDTPPIHTRQFMHTQLGDLRSDTLTHVEKWLQSIGKGDNMRYKHDTISFCMKPTRVFYPTSSEDSFKCSAQHLLDVFSDPYLYKTDRFLDNIRTNINNAENRTARDEKFLRTNIANLRANANDYKDNLIRYYNSQINGVHNKNDHYRKLALLELHPFRSVYFDANDRITLIPRETLMDIPLIDMDIIGVRACHFLSHGYSGHEIVEIENKFTDRDVIEYLKDSEDYEGDILEFISDLSKSLINAYIKVYGKRIDQISDINALLDDDMRLSVYNVSLNITLPVLLDGFVRAANTNAALDTTVTLDHPRTFTQHSGGYSRDISSNNLEDMGVDVTLETRLHDNLEFTRLYHTHRISSYASWSHIARAAALMMQYTKLSPSGFKATLSEECPAPFTVDFVNFQRLASTEIMYVPSCSQELLMAPGPANIEKQSSQTEDLRVFNDCNMMTTYNTVGPSAIVASHFVPTTSSILPGLDEQNNMKLSSDHVTYTFLTDAEDALPGNNDTLILREQAITVVRHQQTRSEQLRYLREGAVETGAFFPFIRPCGIITDEPLPITGLKLTHHMPQNQFSSRWEQFYMSTEPSTNPYASNLFAFYPDRILRNNTIVGEEKLYMFQTSNDTQGTTLRSDTFQFLSDCIFNFNDKNMATISKYYTDQLSLGARYQRPQGKVEFTHPITQTLGPSTQVSRLDVPALFGYSIGMSTMPFDGADDIVSPMWSLINSPYTVSIPLSRKRRYVDI